MEHREAMRPEMSTGRASLWQFAWTDEDVQWFTDVLTLHALVEIRCDHDAKTDTPICNCALARLGSWPSVQKAKEAWALHVMGELRKSWPPTAEMLAHQARQRTGGRRE